MIPPYFTLAPPAGLYRNGTIYQSKGRWYDANLMRFQQDEVKPIGGWQLRSGSASAYSGAARAALSWRDNSNNNWIAVGTSSHLYVQDESGANHDITPIRKTTNPMGPNPFATSSTSSPTITVTDTAHGAVATDTVIFSGATAFAGFTTGQINVAFVIQTVIDANTYTITGPQNATSVTSGGGSAVIANYEITSGRMDATQNLGYGGSTYGTGFYGVPRPNTGALLPATVWSLDSWGQYVVGCADSDGALYQWTLNTATPAAVLSGAPTSCAGLFSTQEFFLFALGAGGDGRRVAWCDQQNNALWTAAPTNQAGDYDLLTVGTLQCGKALPSGGLCFTDVDLWIANYIGAPLVYGFQRVGSGCGVISKGAVAAVDSTAVWMGPGPVFWLFNGQAVEPLDCDVLDYVSNMNANQQSKVTAVHVALYGEIWWFYPSASSNENDTYVCWCYRESERLGRNVWSFGKLARTCGTGKGVFVNPLMVDPSGLLWLHESGLNWQGVQPYIETGPVEIGDGERMAEVQRVIPDEQQDGNFTGQFFGRLWPDGAEFSSAPFTLTSPTEILFQARELRARWTLNQPVSGRIGLQRLELVPGDSY